MDVNLLDGRRILSCAGSCPRRRRDAHRAGAAPPRCYNFAEFKQQLKMKLIGSLTSPYVRKTRIA
ncbi:MAG: hypothetical protein KJZ90_12235, partial [Rhodocyclaceae bacterium]|nr:hypothetical protein [Rhodocyclaceae bacterium]